VSGPDFTDQFEIWTEIEKDFRNDPNSEAVNRKLMDWEKVLYLKNKEAFGQKKIKEALKKEQESMASANTTSPSE
jgi:predicted lipoprotein